MFLNHWRQNQMHIVWTLFCLLGPILLLEIFFCSTSTKRCSVKILLCWSSCPKALKRNYQLRKWESLNYWKSPVRIFINSGDNNARNWICQGPTHWKGLSEENDKDVDGERNSVCRLLSHPWEEAQWGWWWKKISFSGSLLPMGRGKMMVEFFSAAIPLKVWRYLRKNW